MRGPTGRCNVAGDSVAFEEPLQITNALHGKLNPDCAILLN
jgi:hypothetical protein